MLNEILTIERLSFSAPWSRELFAAELDNPRSLSLGAGRGCALAAYIFLWVIGDEAQLHTIAVRPSQRGQGVASYLMRAAFRLARFRGAAWASLEVRGSNHVARCLYEKHGFTVVGRRPAYYRKPVEDALLMNKDLRKI
jgi:ribosomal-protein-alanine N-acetyltransferase